MNEFKTSYILIALKGNVPIIPVYTDGRYGLFKRCHVIIGEKIYLSDYCQSENPSKEQIEYLNQIVTKKIVSLGKLMEQKMNKDKYNKLFSFKGFIKDIGRVIVFTMNLHFRVKVTTKNHQKLKIKGGRIIVANHISFFDPLVLIIALFRRRIYILTAEVVYDHHPIRAKFLNSIGCIRIDRNKHDFDAIKKCIDIASSGGVILIFPSGHLNFKNEIDEFKSGASLIATQANVPLTCAYIERFKHRFHHYYVHFGDTIYLDQQDTYSLKMIDDISQRLFNNMKQLEYNVKEVNK
jgi:1-acyl-sn-glycerol-3-phosphate acyltransferase